MLRNIYVLVFAGLLLAGCDQKALLQKFVPKDDDDFARRFLDAVRAGNYAVADEALDASIRGGKSATGLHELNGVLAHGEPVSVEVTGFNVFETASPRGSTRTTNLSYQIRFPDSWAAGNVAVRHPGGGLSVVDAHFRPIPDSLEVLNRFSFSGKSVVHYLVFAACMVMPAFILLALIVCIRSRVRRKWLWIIFILFGFVQCRLDWASGHFGVQPGSILLFGASAFRPGPYGPWLIGFAIPLGAIIFLACRRRLLVDDGTREAIDQ